ncbi:MAG: class IV adenylate cyclase [Acidobacteria bacterium]|nr:class IV adenylate cyclase [Acidobacteriota bacterium]
MKRIAKQEIEVKLRVTDPAAMRRLLVRLCARVLRRVHEMNTLFDTPRGTLRKRGRLLRLRVETPLAGPRRAQYVLTLKGPSRPKRGKQGAQAESLCYPRARYKVRSEMETVLPHPQPILAVLELLGLRPTFRYEKIRTSFHSSTAPGVHLELDETPAGVFLELEGPRRSIDRLARQLGYGPAGYITKSYLVLHFEECRRRGVRAGDMVFGAGKVVPGFPTESAGTQKTRKRAATGAVKK